MKKAFLVILFLIVSGSLSAWAWYNTAMTTDSRNNEAVFFSIPKGQGISSTAKILKEEKLISSSLAFKIYFKLNKDKVIQAGAYEIEPGLSTRLLVAKLTAGKILSNESKVLVREGLTIKEANEEIKAQGYLLNDEFLNLSQVKIKDLPVRLKTQPFIALLPPEATLEGYLFPDTYIMYKDFSVEDLVEKMLDNFQRKIDDNEIISLSQNLNRSLHETIIMASLIEKEVRGEEDMKIVSGVFLNRIRSGQALQSCASLAYILGVNKPQYSYEDTQTPSPYNTYLHPGLPPGPVSNPGLVALRAAVQPIITDYNYFLSRPDTGETVFSATYEEHLSAKAKYLD